MPVLSTNASLIYPMIGRIPSAEVEPLAQGALNWIKGRYGRDLRAGNYTDRFDSANEPFLFLSNPPVTSLTEVRVGGTVFAGWETYLRFTPEGRVSFKQRPFWSMWSDAPLGRFWNQTPGFAAGIDNVEIDYVSAGATQSEIDLYVGAVVNWWADANRRSAVVQSESIGDRSYTMGGVTGQIPSSVTSILFPLVPKRAG